MQEHRVTIQSRTYTLDEPFYVFATQNPIELEGTYPLPEAQLRSPPSGSRGFVLRERFEHELADPLLRGRVHDRTEQGERSPLAVHGILPRGKRDVASRP